MYTNQFCIIDPGPKAGGENRRVRTEWDRMKRKRPKTMHVPRELMALVSYLRQQEARVLDAMQQLQDAS